MKNTTVILVLSTLLCTPCLAQSSWTVDARSSYGPLVQVDMPNVSGKRRSAFVSFEYARRCDPLFSYVEMFGNALGTPVSQEKLSGTKIGLFLNGVFYSSAAAKTVYSNGYEAAFSISTDLFHKLQAGGSLTLVTIAGEQIPLPTKNLQGGLQSALAICAKKVQ